MEYVETHHKYWEEGYEAAKFGSVAYEDNPYNFIDDHYFFSAWEAGYQWYISQVH